MPSSSEELRSKLLSKLGITKQKKKTTSINDRRTRDIRHMSRYTLPLLYDEEEEKIREMSVSIDDFNALFDFSFLLLMPLHIMIICPNIYDNILSFAISDIEDRTVLVPNRLLICHHLQQRGNHPSLSVSMIKSSLFLYR